MFAPLLKTETPPRPRLRCTPIHEFSRIVMGYCILYMYTLQVHAWVGLHYKLLLFLKMLRMYISVCICLCERLDISRLFFWVDPEGRFVKQTHRVYRISRIVTVRSAYYTYIYIIGLFEIIYPMRPSRSPDLTLCEQFFWGYVNDILYIRTTITASSWG